MINNLEQPTKLKFTLKSDLMFFIIYLYSSKSKKVHTLKCTPGKQVKRCSLKDDSNIYFNAKGMKTQNKLCC